MNDPILISSLGHFACCPRQCALMFVEGIWSDNIHTVQGTLAHERVDHPGSQDDQDGNVVIRALPLYSNKYGLSGKADVVEFVEEKPIPVEYKKSRKKNNYGNYEIQLCAQALCLEEMFGCDIPVGYIYHIGSKRRREVPFTDQLRYATVSVIEKVREMLGSGQVPPPLLKPQCEGCSLHKVCMPELQRISGDYSSKLWNN